MRISDWSSDVCSSDLPAEASLAQASAPEVPPSMACPGTAHAAAMPPNEMPGNEMNATPAGLQTASLSVGSIGDTSLLFEVDSAELSPEVQSELRSLAEALRGDAGAIQVLGFAGPQADVGAGGEANGQNAVEDQARKLALSRALKVRSFLIDAGIPSRSEEHTSELPSLMRISSAVFCSKINKE